jgi:hypothetical protein
MGRRRSADFFQSSSFNLIQVKTFSKQKPVVVLPKHSMRGQQPKKSPAWFDYFFEVYR